MSELEGHVILTIALILLSTTGSRFVIQELIAVVKLCKELKAEFREPLPPSQRPLASSDTGSKNVSRLPDRRSAEWSRTRLG